MIILINYFLDNKTVLKYENSTQSSLTILGKSLQSNRTYQFMVHMEYRRNPSIQAIGYALVKIEDTNSPTIAIR